MARAIVYCDRCGRMIPPGEVDEALVAGQSLVPDDWVAVCRDCLSALSPEERISLSVERPTRAAERPSPSPVARAIVYCDKCCRMIPPSEMGEALLADWVAVCRDCLGALSPEERISLAVQRPTRAAGRRKKFGRYELIRELGRGGQAVVYEARDPQLGRSVALKILLPGSRTPDGIKRFQREARSAARLRHRNVISIYEVGEWRGWHFIAMEIAPGDPLDAVIASRRLGARDAVRLVEQIAGAVTSAHQEGIIHRDLKPSNILMDAAGNPKLTDFGFALDVDAGTKLTRSGEMMGTPAYMPPEQARGRAHEVDERSDVYSMGAVLYEMLTGRPPFRARSSLLILEKVVYELPKNPSEIRKAVPEDAATIALKCLEKERDRRYQTAGELADDCRRFLAGEPVSARRASLTYKARRSMARHAAVFTVLGVGLAAIVGMIITSAVTMSRERAVFEKWREEVKKRRAAAEGERKTVASARALFSEGKLVEAEQVLQKLLGRGVTARRARRRGREAGAPDRGRIPSDGVASARKRLDEIKSMTGASLERYAEARAALVEFAEKFDDAACLKEAERLLAKIDADFGAAADEALEKAADSARALAAEGKFHEAKKALGDIGERFGESGWFETSGKEVIAEALGKIDAARSELPKGLVARARKALESGKFGEARAALRGRAAWPAELRVRADQLSKKIDETEAKSKTQAKRKEAWPAFLCGFADAGKVSLVEAKAFLERERKSLAELGPDKQIEGKLQRIESRFREVRLVEELAEVNFRGARGTIYFTWKGERVGGKVRKVEKGVVWLLTARGRHVSVPIAELAGVDVVRYSRTMQQGSREKLRAAAYLLLRGDPAAAREANRDAMGDRAWSLGEQIGEFAKAIEAREARLAAAAKAEEEAGAAAKAEADAAREEAREKATAGLVAHWTFDDRADPGADSSGKGHHGKVHGATWTAKGKLGGALEFDGIDDCVTVPYSPSLGFSSRIDYTVAAWVKFHRLGRYHGIVSHGPPSRGWLLYYAKIWGPTLEYGARVNVRPFRGAVAVPNEWYHIAAVLDRNGNGQMYVNGQPSGYPVALDGSSFYTKTEVLIGKCTGNRVYLDGTIDDLRIYNRALPGEEVKALFEGRAAEEATPAKTPARPPGPEKAEVGLPGGPKEPLPGGTGMPGEWAPGLVCEIFKGKEFTNRVGVRIDSSPVCDFGRAPPDLGLAPGEYSFRWKGYLLAPVTGRYSFNRPEGFRTFKIDGKKAFDAAGGVELAKGLHGLEAAMHGRPGVSRTWLQFNTPAGGNKDLGTFLYHEVPELGSMGPFAKVVQGLKAEYFKDDNCRRLVATGTIQDLDSYLRDSGACTLCGKDGFSMRASGYLLVPEDGEYTFMAEKYRDDGVQVYVHGKLVVDTWEGNAGRNTGKLNLSAGFSRLKIRFRNTKYMPRLSFLWQGPRRGTEPIPPHCLFMDAPRPRLVKRTGLAPGVRGYLYRGARPAGRPVADRIDPSLSFDWSGKRPAPNMPDGDFSALWRGFIMVPESGPHVFRVEHDGGGVQLSVGGRRIVNRLGSSKGNVFSNAARLPRGATGLDLCYSHKKSNKAFVRISWMGPDFHMRPVAGGDLAHRGKFTIVGPLPEPLPPKAPAREPKKPAEPLPKGNLVPNGGFEKPGTAREIAEGWTKHQWGSARGSFSVRVDRVNSYRGDRSLLARTLTKGVHPGAQTTLTSALVPGRYELRFWACAAVGKSADICAHLAGRDVMSATVGEDWKQLTTTVEIEQKKKVRASLRLYTTTSKVRVWFDEVELEASASPQVR